MVSNDSIFDWFKYTEYSQTFFCYMLFVVIFSVYWETILFESQKYSTIYNGLNAKLCKYINTFMHLLCLREVRHF